MARVTPILVNIIGSVAGLTFQNNSSGLILRQRPTVKKTSTIKQQRAHANHQDALYNYQLLDNTNKDLWNDYATAHTKINKFGQEKKLTGQNWYESLNYMRALISESVLASPPSYLLPAAPPAFEIVLSASAIKINITGSLDYSENAIIIWSTIPTSRIKPSINHGQSHLIEDRLRHHR